MHAEEPARETYRLTGPDGRVLEIPVGVDPARDPYRALTTPEARRAYYEQEGYVVVRGLMPPDLCEAMARAYLTEVKPSREYFCRHESGRMEQHVLTDAGYMKYPMVNFHDVYSGRFPRFRETGLAFLTHARMQEAARLLLGEPGKLVHTFFAEGNQRTWAHRDSYYIEADVVGGLMGIWVALEDIDPGAGRLYVYPRSHRTVLPGIDDHCTHSPNDADFKELMLQGVRESGLECRAPALRRGDAILFSSLTVHGSLETTRPHCSRLSVAGHYIAESRRFMWLRAREPRVRARTVNGMTVCHHHDEDVLRHRVGTFLSTRYPSQYRLLRHAMSAL